LGTYLVNITRNVTPYGGADFAHRQSSTYNSYGDYFEFGNNQTSTAYVFDGDCFI
jgi:outer membrane receptor for ferric coprogen and ferric-rhodotorulic acid